MDSIPTYYNRAQLKPAPFNAWVVGGYVFLAGLSGGAAVLAAILQRSQRNGDRASVRHGRLLSVLAPTIGSVLLIYDLHTPQRFYNMLRIAKRTSPMSIGTWLLGGFTVAAGATLAGEYLPSLRRLGRIAAVPQAVFGAGICTYTAALLSATSTPSWAVIPRALGIRFAGSAIASAASALALLSRSRATRDRLDTLAVAALAAELAGDSMSAFRLRQTGVESAMDSAWGRAETLGATLAGTAAPLVLHVAGGLAGREGPGRVARGLVLLGSALLRVSVIGVGQVSASSPGVSLRFSQPENLPR